MVEFEFMAWQWVLHYYIVTVYSVLVCTHQQTSSCLFLKRNRIIIVSDFDLRLAKHHYVVPVVITNITVDVLTICCCMGTVA